MTAYAEGTFSIAFLLLVFPLNIHLLPIAKDFASESRLTINQIISKRFQNCEVVHVAPQHSKKEQIQPDMNIGIPESSSGQFIAKIGTNVTFERLEAHRLTTEICGVAVIFAVGYSEELSKWMFETLTPLNAPIIRKGEDHVIFICVDPEVCDQILLSPNFGNKIKFKISISPMEYNAALRFKTVDLYGSNGNPVLVNLLSHSSILFPDTTRNFNGKVFRVSNPRTNTYFEVESSGNGIGKRGLYKMWLDEMMERFNFSAYVFESSLSGGSGKQFPNKTWGGTVGDVMDGSADMGAFVGVIYNRQRVVGFSTTVSYEWLVFITHKPRTFYTCTAMFRPLSLQVWIGFSISLLFMGAALKLILKSELNLDRYLNFVITSFIEKNAAHYINQRGNATRVLITFWLMYALIFSTAYKGKLISLIAFPISSWIPLTYEDLAYSVFRIGLHVVGKGGASDVIFSSSTNPVIQILNSRMEAFSDPSFCMREAIMSDIACVTWKGHFEYGLHDEFTDEFGRSPFVQSTEASYFIQDGFIWEQRAVFRHHIDKLGWSILETGLSSFWLQSDHKAVRQRRFGREKDAASNNDPEMDKSKTTYFIEDIKGPSKLKLAQLKGLFILFGCGMAIGIAHMVWELISRTTHCGMVLGQWKKL